VENGRKSKLTIFPVGFFSKLGSDDELLMAKASINNIEHSTMQSLTRAYRLL